MVHQVYIRLIHVGVLGDPGQDHRGKFLLQLPGSARVHGDFHKDEVGVSAGVTGPKVRPIEHDLPQPGVKIQDCRDDLAHFLDQPALALLRQGLGRDPLLEVTASWPWHRSNPGVVPIAASVTYWHLEHPRKHWLMHDTTVILTVKLPVRRH